MIENILSTGWIKNYKKEYLPKDLTAGLSVAAIALPVGIAYAGIAGLPPEAGLYSCILPMIAYALFGSSKQLIVGPDAATCILIASSLAPLAAAGTADYQTLSVALTMITGILCIVGGIFKLGFLADFLSKPILTGYLNGLGITIITGQLGKLFGFELTYDGFLRTLTVFFSRLEETNLTTLTIGISIFVFLRIFKKFAPKFPAPLIAVVLSIAIVIMKNLEASGVAVVGSIPKGFPGFSIPSVSPEHLKSLFADSSAIVLISFCSAMLTSKSFAVKNNYGINPDKDFIALGAANFLSGLSQGFVISGADSRTAVNDTSGGKTQLVSIVASLSIIIVVLFFTDYLQYLPVTALSAIIVSATIGFFNLSYFRKLFIVSKKEFWLAIITLLSVITVGVVPAVLIAVSLSLLNLLARASRPDVTILGKAKGTFSYQSLEEYRDADTYPGILVVRFESSLLFFNAQYFRDSVVKMISVQKDKVKYLVIDASPVIIIDITAADTVVDLEKELNSQGTELLFARARHNVQNILTKSGYKLQEGVDNYSLTVHQCVDNCLQIEKNK